LSSEGQLSRRYSPELASKVELIEADDRGEYPKMRLHYFLTTGRDFWAERDRHIASSQFEKFGDFFLPDINGSKISG
jgi:hypothetical protein